MLNPEEITRRAKEILSSKKLKPELSEQALAVIEAICDIGNTNQLLVSKALIRQMNAVKETPSGRMKRPSLEEIRRHGQTIGLPESECDGFFNHYEGNGWKVGRNPMKLWTAAMANWKRTWQSGAGGSINGNVATIQNQNALNRVEERIKALRGQAPFSTGDRRITELSELKTERTRLMGLLGFK